MLPQFLLLALLPIITLASPLSPTRSLEKRSNPNIASGYSAQHTTQIQDAFSNALELANYVQTAPASTVDSIFKKYFNEGDKDKVMAVFSSISGGNPNKVGGSDLLGKITVVPDYKDGGVLACDGDTMAELRDYMSDSPKLVICDGPGFGHGGIDLGYTGVPRVGCDTLDPRVSWKMETLGSILLHEYTHYYNLVVPPLSKETDDPAYGPNDARAYDKSKATNNADSYSWFANEVLWTVLCSTDYGDPANGDDADPYCNDTTCTAPKGSA